LAPIDQAVLADAKTVMLTLLHATEMSGSKAWALETAFAYVLGRDPHTDKREAWKELQDIYQKNLTTIYPDQEDPAQSFRRVSGDAFEAFVEGYLNSNEQLKREGIRAVRLRGEDFDQLMQRLGIDDLEPKDIDMFLQGVMPDGRVELFGAVFPKASYAERIRADEYASRRLMEKGLFSVTITIDARDELGTEEHPSVKRRKINSGAFHACYSFHRGTAQGPKVRIVQCHIHGMSNPLVRDVVKTWRHFRDNKSVPTADAWPA